jgi:hypothetical protein
MSLRIRRGTDAQRQTITFDSGEVVYTTDEKKLFIGDGIAQGGVNVLATSAGVGLTFNAVTQTIDFDANDLGLTTDDVQEAVSPNNLWFTTQRAQDAAASLFTSVGSPTSSGTITGTITPGIVTVSVAPTNMVQGERFVVSGTGGNGLSAGTYYVVSQESTSIVLANSLAHAMAGTAISSLNTGSITGTTYQAGGTDTGITFVYDPINHVINVTANGIGITSVSQDTSPQLGGNLNLNSHNIFGTGTITATSLNTSHVAVNSNNITSDLAYTAYDPIANTSSNLLVVGSPTTANTIYVHSANDPALYIRGVNADPFSASIKYAVSRGTASAPAIIQTSDSIGTINFNAYDGAEFLNGAGIQASVESVTSGNVSASLTIGVTKTDGNRTRFTFKPSGTLEAPTLKVGSYAGSGTYPAAEAGMIIFDSNTNRFYGYNGTTWKTLDN